MPSHKIHLNYSEGNKCDLLLLLLSCFSRFIFDQLFLFSGCMPNPRQSTMTNLINININYINNAMGQCCCYVIGRLFVFPLSHYNSLILRSQILPVANLPLFACSLNLSQVIRGVLCIILSLLDNERPRLLSQGCLALFSLLEHYHSTYRIDKPFFICTNAKYKYFLAIR